MSLPSVPTPPPAGQVIGLLLDAGASSARFTIDRGGGPGLINYRLCYSIRVAEDSRRMTMRIDHAEYWVLGPDGSVYENRIHRSREGEKPLGGISSKVGIGCLSSDFADPNLDRPTATLYRVTLHYTFEGRSPGGVQEVTTESGITENVPARPLMTGLTMTSDVPGQPPCSRHAGR